MTKKYVWKKVGMAGGKGSKLADPQKNVYKTTKEDGDLSLLHSLRTVC